MIRNLSFLKGNEHQIMKCTRLVDIITGMFIDYQNKEITLNCLDIITALGKHIVLKEVQWGKHLVNALFNCIRST